MAIPILVGPRIPQPLTYIVRICSHVLKNDFCCKKISTVDFFFLSYKDEDVVWLLTKNSKIE